VSSPSDPFDLSKAARTNPVLVLSPETLAMLGAEPSRMPGPFGMNVVVSPAMPNDAVLLVSPSVYEYKQPVASFSRSAPDTDAVAALIVSTGYEVWSAEPEPPRSFWLDRVRSWCERTAGRLARGPEGWHTRRT